MPLIMRRWMLSGILPIQDINKVTDCELDNFAALDVPSLRNSDGRDVSEAKKCNALLSALLNPRL